jgi:hypothetical protein
MCLICEGENVTRIYHASDLTELLHFSCLLGMSYHSNKQKFQCTVFSDCSMDSKFEFQSAELILQFNTASYWESLSSGITFLTYLISPEICVMFFHLVFRDGRIMQ